MAILPWVKRGIRSITPKKLGCVVVMLFALRPKALLLWANKERAQGSWRTVGARVRERECRRACA
eukprot:13258164-Alexandrium_andersonii.AAC.1